MREELTAYQILLRCRLSARYHQQRRRVLLRRSRIASYLGVAFSMGMVVSVIQSAPHWLQLGIPFVVALASLADTLFGYTAQAYEHMALYRRYMELEQWMLRTEDEMSLREAHARIAAIEADEPPVNAVAVDVCDNELLVAHGHEIAHAINPIAKFLAMI